MDIIQDDATNNATLLRGDSNTSEMPVHAGETSAIDWSKIDPADIPTEVVKATGLYQSVLSEAIDRRHTIKALQERLAGQDGKPVENVSPTSETAQQQNDDPLHALRQDFTALVQYLVDKEREETVAGVISRNKLTPQQAEVLRLVPPENVEAVAKQLRSMGTVSTTSGGQGSTTDKLDAIAKRMLQAAGNGFAPGSRYSMDLFDPALHSSMSGGT